MRSFFTSVILPAAGSGLRMGGVSKQLLPILGKTVLEYTVEPFEASALINEILVAAKPEELETIRALVQRAGFSKVRAVVPGGLTRQDSVAAALSHVSGQSDFVAIHDGDRPLITVGAIDDLIRAAYRYGSVCAAAKINETVKSAAGDLSVSSTVDRTHLYLAQTPQIFPTALYRKAVLASDLSRFTDDASIAEHAGVSVRLMEIDGPNFKLTTQSDLRLITAILEQRQEDAKGGDRVRIGHGYDVHRFQKDRKLILGGVVIDYEMGLAGHSDADVLVHAVIDSLLGAAAMGDIGRHFPDTDNAYRDISSLCLLEQTAALLRGAGYRIINIDVTVAAQKPKLSPYIEAMRQAVSSVLALPADCISIKATTEEKLGFTGRLEGIKAYAVCLIEA